MCWECAKLLHLTLLPFPTLSEPVSQLRADFTLYHGDSGPTVELSCLASSGSPPIVYSLVGNDGRVHAQQRPLHGKPANFSIPLAQMSGWFHCEAANSVSVDSSARVLLPPGEKALPGLERGLQRVQEGGRGWGTAGSATAQGRVGLRMLRASLAPGLAKANPGSLPPYRGAARDSHLHAGWQPGLYCSY